MAKEAARATTNRVDDLETGFASMRDQIATLTERMGTIQSGKEPAADLSELIRRQNELVDRVEDLTVRVGKLEIHQPPTVLTQDEALQAIAKNSYQEFVVAEDWTYLGETLHAGRSLRADHYSGATLASYIASGLRLCLKPAKAR